MRILVPMLLVAGLVLASCEPAADDPTPEAWDTTSIHAALDTSGNATFDATWGVPRCATVNSHLERLVVTREDGTASAAVSVRVN
ncbi:MAG TPA: hypothetical protein VF815_29735 [Myxococcaceae bacterium]|jgi:hypothetical protein